MIKKTIIVGLIVMSLMMLSVSVALGAQGQITEVNPSGIGKAITSSDGNVIFGLKGTPAVSEGFGESTVQNPL